MEEQPAVQRFREYLADFAAGDTAAMRDYFSDDVVWHVAGNHPLSGDYVGKEALFDYFARTRELTGGSLTLDVESILASGPRLAVFTRTKGAREGRTLDALLAQAFELGPDGRVTEYYALADDQKAVDAFWS